MEGTFKVLSIDTIRELNHILITRTGGKAGGTFLNPAPLEYILEAVRGSFYKVDRYPTFAHKAAAIGWWITNRWWSNIQWSHERC